MGVSCLNISLLDIMYITIVVVEMPKKLKDEVSKYKQNPIFDVSSTFDVLSCYSEALKAMTMVLPSTDFACLYGRQGDMMQACITSLIKTKYNVQHDLRPRTFPVSLKHESTEYAIMMEQSPYHYVMNAATLGYNDRNIIPMFLAEFMKTKNVLYQEKKCLVIYNAEYLTEEAQKIIDSLVPKYQATSCIYLLCNRISEMYVHKMQNFAILPFFLNDVKPNISNIVLDFCRQELHTMNEQESSYNSTHALIQDTLQSIFDNTSCLVIHDMRKFIHNLRCSSFTYSSFVYELVEYTLMHRASFIQDEVIEWLEHVATMDVQCKSSYRDFFLWELTLHELYMLYNDVS